MNNKNVVPSAPIIGENPPSYKEVMKMKSLQSEKEELYREIQKIDKMCESKTDNFIDELDNFLVEISKPKINLEVKKTTSKKKLSPADNNRLLSFEKQKELYEKREKDILLGKIEYYLNQRNKQVPFGLPMCSIFSLKKRLKRLKSQV